MKDALAKYPLYEHFTNRNNAKISLQIDKMKGARSKVSLRRAPSHYLSHQKAVRIL